MHTILLVIFSQRLSFLCDVQLHVLSMSSLGACSFKENFENICFEIAIFDCNC